MLLYYVNKNAKANGDHEVHQLGCEWMPNDLNWLYLGRFENCFDAVKEAKKFYPQSNGCYYCTRECHIS